MFTEHILQQIENKEIYNDINQFVKKACCFTQVLNKKITQLEDISDDSIDLLIRKTSDELNFTIVYTDHYDEYPEIPGAILPRTHDVELTDHYFEVLITTVCDIKVINNVSLVLDLPKNMRAFVYAKNEIPYFIVAQISRKNDNIAKNMTENVIYTYDVEHYKFECLTITEDIDMMNEANKKLVSDGYNERYWESQYYFME